MRSAWFGRAMSLSLGWLVAHSAFAQTFVQWNFNSSVSDSNVATGVLTPSIPTSPGVLTLIGGVTMSMQSGDANNSSSDSSSGDDSALQITNFPIQGTGSGLAGVQIAASTVGWTNIVFEFDVRHSLSSPNSIQLDYSTDGVTFVPGQTYSASLGGELWYDRLAFDFTTIPAASDNPNFKVRIVAVFDPANPAAYTGTGGAYSTTGALRFDMIGLSGAPIAPIPPSGVAVVQPQAVCAQGGPLLFRIPVNRGINPNSSSLQVRANLTELGGSSSQSLFDNGLNGDVTPNDRIYAFAYNAPPGLSLGPKVITITISDGQGRSFVSNVSVNVGNCAQASTSRVVISQIYGGGGNTPLPASTYNIDFIELYNRSASPVDISGWSVQFASPVDPLGFFDNREIALLSGILHPGQYYLIRCTVPNTLGAATPHEDARLNELIGVGHTGGRVALMRNAIPLGSACSSTDMEDFVGYGGAASCFEGIAPSGTVDNDTAAVRKLNGAQDTDQTFNDFEVATPNPRNRSFGGFLAGYASTVSPGVCKGEAMTISVSVSPATAPPSTTIQVSADLSALGGPTTQVFSDLGNNTFELSYQVPGSVPDGAIQIPIVVSDEQGRTDNSSLRVVVATCQQSAAQIVISGLYPGGGNAGSILNADFVELFNRSQIPVDITGWTLQYAAYDNPAGFSGSRQITLVGVLQPGSFYLVQASAASLTNGTPLTIADVIAVPALGMDNEYGRVALVRNAVPIGLACNAPSVEDFIGYGSLSPCQEGTAPTDKLANGVIAWRRAGGCQDFNQNIVDFELLTDSTLPRNSLSPLSPCGAPSTGTCCIGTTCTIATAAACTGTFNPTLTLCGPSGNPTVCCPANINQVDGITVQDIFDFLNAWFIGSALADFNNASGVTVQDIFDYLNAWFSGC